MKGALALARQQEHSGLEGQRQESRPGERCRRASSIPGPVPHGGARPARPRTAPGPAATGRRSDHAPAALAELFPEPARAAAIGWTGCGHCKTIGHAGRPRRPGTDTAGWPRATDDRHARAGSGDRSKTSLSPAAAADVAAPECVFRSCLGTPVEPERDRRAHFVPDYAAGKARPSTADRRRRWALVNKAAIVAVAPWPSRAVVDSVAPGRLGTPARGRVGLERCHATATCVHDPAPGAPPDGRSGNSSMPGCGLSSRAVHGSLAERTTASTTKFLLRDHALAQPL